MFNPAQAERDAAIITEAYSQQGRIAATVTPRIIRLNENRVDLVFEISEGDTIEIERISFVGNRVFSDRRLRGVLETKQAGIFRAFFRQDTLVEDRIEFDKQVLRDFYLSRGYIDFRTNSVNVELTRERDAFFLVFNVQEGQQFRFGNITTVSEIPEADAELFQDALKIKPGAVYSPTLIENSIARQERLALRQGIDFLRVEPRINRNDRDLTLDVEFVLVKGPRIFIERIDIEGNTATLDRVIRQQFRVVEGDPFNPREVRESAERIRALGFFETADVEAREGSSPEQVLVDVNVVEQPTGSLTLGGTFDTNGGFGVNIGIQERNFLGRGQNLGFSVSTSSQNLDLALRFTEPYLLGRDLQFDLATGYTRTNSNFLTYNTQQAFFSPGLSFPISDNGRLRVGYSFLQNEMLTRTGAVTGQVIQNEIATGKRTSSSLTLGYLFDSRLTGLNPNAGVLFSVDSEFAALGGDDNYIKTRARAIAQTKIFNEEVVLRATLEGGVLNWRSDNFSRSVDRFQLGPTIMRGFEPAGIGPREIETATGVDDALGGNLYSVLKLETEFPSGLPEELGLRLALFYDIGNLWNLDNVDTSGTAPGEIVGASGSFRQVIGVSLLWDTTFGPLRFDFTKALKKEPYDKEQTFNFSVSTQF